MKINFFKALIKDSLRRFGLDLSIYRPSSDAFLVKKDRLKKCVQPLTIFDIGANEGEITDRYSQMFPTAKIYSFEPVPEVFTILERKFHENPQIIVNQLACLMQLVRPTFTCTDMKQAAGILCCQKLQVPLLSLKMYLP